MPTVPKQQVPAKRSSESQEQDISKQFTVKAHGAALINIQRWLLENEKYYKDLQAVKAKLERNKARINDLQRENRGLKGDLNARTSEVQNFAELNGDLKVDLLKHQHVNQVADSQIVDMYKLLHANISSWVDAEVGGFEEQWRTEHDNQYPQSEVFQHGNVPAYIEFLKAGYQFGGEYLVESQVHMRLHDLLFKKDQPFVALVQNEKDFIHNFEAGLATLDPPRDDADIQYLRSEVLKGFAASPEFQGRRTTWMSKIGVSILRSAEKILPSCHEDEHRKRQESFQLQVLEPAFDLAVAMKTSSVCYEFTECFTRETQLKTFPMKNYHYDYCTMIDIDTRKSLKKIPKGHNGDKAIGADQVLMLAPGLIRRAGDETKKLTPEMVCVKVDLSAIIDDDDDEPTMKQEDSDPFMMPGPGANVNSGPTDHEPPKKKQKLLKPSLPIDLDSEEEAKTEGNPDRPQRHIKRPIIYGLYPDDGTSGLD